MSPISLDEIVDAYFAELGFTADAPETRARRVLIAIVAWGLAMRRFWR